LLPALPLTARAETRRGDFLVSSYQVAHAMHAAGVPVTTEGIEFLSSVRTRQPNAALKLINVGSWQDGILRAELRCAEPGECLPFYVLVHDSSTMPDLWSQSTAQTTTPVRGIHKTYDVRIGDPATLVFEGRESRITVRVICAQNGDRGQKIRVASRDRKHFYQAEIVEPGLLKGIL